MFSSASFKTNITFCHLVLKFLFFFAKGISKIYTPSIGVGQSLSFYCLYKNKFKESIIYYFNLHNTKLYKICLLSYLLFCLKKFDAYLEKVRIFAQNFQKIFRILLVLNKFYHCFKASA